MAIFCLCNSSNSWRVILLPFIPTKIVWDDIFTLESRYFIIFFCLPRPASECEVWWDHCHAVNWGLWKRTWVSLRTRAKAMLQLGKKPPVSRMDGLVRQRDTVCSNLSFSRPLAAVDFSPWCKFNDLLLSFLTLYELPIRKSYQGNVP